MPLMTISCVWRVAGDVEGRIFVGDLAQAAGDLLLVAAGLGFDGQTEHRRGKLRSGQFRSVGADATVSPICKVFDLGHGDDVAGDGFRIGFCVLPCMSSRPPVRDDLPVRRLTSGCSAVDLAGVDADEAEIAHELVVQRLEHLADELGRFGRLEFHSAPCRPALGRSPLLALHWGQGKRVPIASSSSSTPMSFLADVQKIGITVPAASALGRAAVKLFAADGALGQVLLHQLFVGLDDGVDQLAIVPPPGRPDSRPAAVAGGLSTLTTPLKSGPTPTGALNSTQPLPKVS